VLNSTVSVHSSEILNSSKSLVVSVSIDSVESYTSIVLNTSVALDQTKTSKVAVAADCIIS
jgi:hypothetical protein